VGPRRAEIIVAGAAVYAELLERCQLQGFRFSPLGLRDGLLAQMAAEYDSATRSGRQLELERLDSIRFTMERYRVEKDHAMQVRDAAMALFTGLKSVHRLGPEYKEWLAAAAMLYEVGDYINRNGRHRHSYYVISSSEILGFTPQQRRTIAAIARYLGKSRPSDGDTPMKLLPPENREPVRRASLLLRLARALNLGRTGAVRKLRTRLRNGKVELGLTTKPHASIDLELWAIEKEAAYFREVFGRALSAAAV
jgi:exopolyphosphatase/guanosine-5'-triphosphate,3'-diphosphate pyrophosphatase